MSKTGVIIDLVITKNYNLVGNKEKRITKYEVLCNNSHVFR